MAKPKAFEIVAIAAVTSMVIGLGGAALHNNDVGVEDNTIAHMSSNEVESWYYSMEAKDKRSKAEQELVGSIVIAGYLALFIKRISSYQDLPDISTRRITIPTV